MVFRSVSETQTPPVAPPSSHSQHPPSMLSAATFHLKPRTTPPPTRKYNFPITNCLRWGMNHPYFSVNHSLNPLVRFGSAPEYKNNPLAENKDDSSGSVNEGDGKPVEEKDKKLKSKGKSSGENSDTSDGGCDEEDENEAEAEAETEAEAEAEAELSGVDEEQSFQLVKTWNLRPRKPVTKPPNPGNNGGSRNRKPRSAGSRARGRARGRAAETKALAAEASNKEVFSVSLNSEEIEDDFMRLTGDKPPKKANKRPRIVQKNLDVCFPGLHLNAVTPEMYQV